MIEAVEKILFDWPTRIFSKSHVQIGSLKYRTKRDGVIVCYSLVDEYFEGNPTSMVTSKPAISGHFKTGQRRASETGLF